MVAPRDFKRPWDARSDPLGLFKRLGLQGLGISGLGFERGFRIFGFVIFRASGLGFRDQSRFYQV